MTTITATDDPVPLRQIRVLRRRGLVETLPDVQRLLAQVPDPLDLETAGRALATDVPHLNQTGLLPHSPLVIYGNSTLDSLGALVTACGIRDGALVTTALADFGVWRTDVLNGAHGLAERAPSPVLLVLDDTAVFDSVRDPVDIAEVAARCAALPVELASWVEAAKAIFGALVVLVTVPLSSLRRDAVIDYRNTAALDQAWNAMNAGILGLAADAAGVVVLSYESVAVHAGALFASDRIRHLAGITFAADYLARLATEVVRVLLANLGRAAKCLVLDLDRTLWDGIVGDDGTSGLRIGGSYPGSAHLELQHLARDLSAQGVLLAIASKNHEDVALAAMTDHPEMVLRPESILAHRIDFEPKPPHLVEIAADLNIAVSALVFMDDNPVERGLVATMQPDVRVIDLPDEPASFASVLAAAGAFNILNRTSEDAARTQMYVAERGRHELRKSTATLSDYLRSLDARLSIMSAVPLNVPRTAQLFGKTNQFNLTGRRYTADQIGRTSGVHPRFLVGRLTDTFGDSGIVVAAAVTEPDPLTWEIENLVLSCRAFNRSVEEAVLATVLAAAATHGKQRLIGAYLPSSKNGAFSDFYARNGFVPSGDDAPPGALWERDTTQAPLSVPQWVTVLTDPEAFDVTA